ncbi:unnamed protein product [Paramecium sonneborni]|uniref:Uncharacterized protein n=1 Tax=Paramecium sonneborni TaxID=65129 RepID=A0A8S1RBQ4_9CILI|nr:unnamed protein product [Paramecium sonneborni]
MHLQIPNKKTNQIRPSMFLNNLDLNTVLLSPKLNPSDIEKSPLISQLRLKKKKDVPKLPVIKEKSNIFISNKQSLENTHYNDSNNQTTSMKASLQKGEQLKLPEIQYTSPQNETKHKKNLTEGNLDKKRVEFRASILVIDFINQVIKKDKIDGSSKPLIRKGFHRQPTKFLPKLDQKNDQI